MNKDYICIYDGEERGKPKYRVICELFGTLVTLIVLDTEFNVIKTVWMPKSWEKEIYKRRGEMKCPICGGELKKMEEKCRVKGFEVPTEFYRCESCGEELMRVGQFRKGMDKIIELKADVLVSSVDGDYIKLPKEIER